MTLAPAYVENLAHRVDLRLAAGAVDAADRRSVRNVIRHAASGCEGRAESGVLSRRALVSTAVSRAPLLRPIRHEHRRHRRSRTCVRSSVASMNGFIRLAFLASVVTLATGCASGPPAPASPSGPTTAAAASEPRRALEAGRAHIARGDMVAATITLREALRLAPELAEARASLGLALYALGDLDAATEELRRAVRVNPDLADARLTLATVLIARQEWQAA